jgi:hypothetical protein
MAYDYAVHSDLLVCWTGKDIDAKHDPEWHTQDRSDTRRKREVEQAYHKRLLSILKYGLWATKPEEEPQDSPIGHVCFTELRLSLCRQHAKRYGRLGIGVKRPFLFDRGGRPVIYYCHQFEMYDHFLRQCREKLANDGKHLLHYFKRMNSGSALNYDLYAESEWRMVLAGGQVDKRLAKSYGETSADFQTYLSQEDPQRQKFRYLVPLDGWLSCIIYPSFSLKARGLEDPDVRAQIRRIKTDRCRANKVEPGNWPVEMNLDLCRNF